MEMKLTDDDDIKLETTLEELALNLSGDRVEADIGCSSDFFSGWGGHFIFCCRRGKERSLLWPCFAVRPQKKDLPSYYPINIPQKKL